MIGANAGTYTVASIIERLYLQALAPPDNQPMLVNLGASVTTVDQDTILIGAFTIPEDEALLRQGALLELGQELVRVTTYDAATSTVTVIRGAEGTVPATYTVPLLMVLNPPYPRATVFETVADNIIQLYPKLFTTSEDLLTPVTDRVYSIPDKLAVTVLTIWPGDFSSVRELHGEIVDFHPMTGGRALITSAWGGQVWLRYRRRMAKATAETDTLDELGMDKRWSMIVLAGAAADLLVGRDLTAAQTEWLKSTLEAENIRVGTRVSLAGGMRQYRNQLLDNFSKEMKAEYRPKVRMRNATSQVV